MSVNRVILIGNLGRDPELKQTKTGMSVCDFSVATTDKLGEGKEETTWHRITAWGKLAEVCSQYLTKGRQVYVDGRIKIEQWEKDGVKRETAKIIATRVEFLGGKGERRDPGDKFGDVGGNYDFVNTEGQPLDDKDIPF